MEFWPPALRELGGLVASGRLRYRESIAQGHRERAGGIHRPAARAEFRQAARPPDLSARLAAPVDP
jgi:hypothetical protein